MSTAVTPRAELAVAIQQVSNRYETHSNPPAELFSDLKRTEQELDRAFAAGDRDAALELVAAWRDEALRMLAEQDPSTNSELHAGVKFQHGARP